MEILENVGPQKYIQMLSRNFCMEITGLSAQNVDSGVCVTKSHQLTVAKILKDSMWQATRLILLLHSIDSAQPKCCLLSLPSRLSHVIFMRVCTVAETPIYFMFVRLSIRMYQRGFHGID
jgi:hypothetical protein